ncbi:BMP family ABC transporter substrate-binding protein [bacterium]|nr:BMP family ABC transporter substrate-binding protein [bacterium]MBU4510729.1 BMP family ABC transporter substrate-binding protein [bacterium]
MKNLSKVFLSLFLVLIILFCTISFVSAEKQLVMAMVTNEAGLGDQCYNDGAWAGLIMAEEKFGIEKKVLESREQANFVPHFMTLAEQKLDLIVAVGFMMTDALAEVAELFPETNFCIVDGVVDAPNVACLLFKENEAAFLVGAVAAKMAKSGIVGFVGGMETPITKKFEAGYRAGVMTANPDVKVLVSYAGTFADPAKGEEMATAQYNQGADVIVQVANQTGLGVINAAKKMNKYVIGAEIDQNYLAPDNVITSMIKRVDIAIFNAAKMVKEGNFKGGIYRYGMKEGGGDIAPTTGKLVPKEILDYVNILKQMIIEGEINPPTTLDELEKFAPPKV